MLEIPILREIYLSGVIVASLIIIGLSLLSLLTIKYKGSAVVFIVDILSPLFMALIMIFLFAGFSWLGVFYFVKEMRKEK